ncbi:MAG: PcfJ domain-containing protein [Acutalibacteraceae bacterium]|nr:PcfJ domain-containing protein [Acutalibacteraceae bacterium]
MREVRKQQLLHSFPTVPNDLMEQMKGKGAANFLVFLTYGAELFVRGFHRYSKGNRLVERQRYVFAKDGAVRYVFDERKGWSVTKYFREPVFCSKSYGYSFDNTYHALNEEAIYNSDMKYCCMPRGEKLMISYLKLYCTHPNIEYLVKSGYAHLIETVYQGYWGGLETLRVTQNINWKSNNLLKMLNLNRTEFKLLKGRECKYSEYLAYRKKYPDYKPEELMTIIKVDWPFINDIEKATQPTGLSAKRLAKYLTENNIRYYDYADYIRQCQQLSYNLKDTAINMPRDFHAMHERLTKIIRIKVDEEANQKLKELYSERMKFEFEYKDLILIQPKEIEEIVKEGKVLRHCVGGYAERHSVGTTNIFFIRKKDAPEVPFYTIEVSNRYTIVQCRGYRNDNESPKPEEVIEFEKQYAEYLEGLKNVRNNNQRTA